MSKNDYPKKNNRYKNNNRKNYQKNNKDKYVTVYDKNNYDVSDLASITYIKNGNEVIFTIKYQGKTKTVNGKEKCE